MMLEVMEEEEELHGLGVMDLVEVAVVVIVVGIMEAEQEVQQRVEQVGLEAVEMEAVEQQVAVLLMMQQVVQAEQ
jgi:hypothetical protein